MNNLSKVNLNWTPSSGFLDLIEATVVDEAWVTTHEGATWLRLRATGDRFINVAVVVGEDEGDGRVTVLSTPRFGLTVGEARLRRDTPAERAWRTPALNPDGNRWTGVDRELAVDLSARLAAAVFEDMGVELR